MPTETRVRVAKPENDEKVFMFTSAGWGYVIVPDEKIVLNGQPYHQKGKRILPTPGEPYRTKDREVIEKLRSHRDYGNVILEYGVHFGEKQHAAHAEE